MNLASLFRYAQLLGHIAHNMCKGETFVSDHPFLAELYEAYEDAYDSIIERMIGLEEEVDLVAIQKSAVEDLFVPKSFQEAFKELLACEKDICAACEKLAKVASLGTNDLLAGLADDSEMRQYKLKQRLK